ncbi:Htur_1727 family rSAM-partnered candidate RiPP [Natronorubrum tibetense]|uniref:Phenylacetic acid degradation B n=1 Tax=Natronorubrum tibetense GA33 TaxID=1114856 RepID=L9VMM7_9EURY|nr:Htur_1727 family rSAM-partnered candidate RiPP [Natronorubrum tibetense]ELY38409.1 phenylacetic acid degradation B [Natronorubrum tibetense GA33]
MVEKARRERVATDDRGNPTQQWDVFCRDEPDEPLRHVGSVAAASGTEAHEHASRLFGWSAVDVWLCPADDVERYSTRGLESDADEPHDRDDPDERDEPRVYEETEGEARDEEKRVTDA